MERSFFCQPGEAQTAQIHSTDVLAGFRGGHPRGEVEDAGLVPGDPGLGAGSVSPGLSTRCHLEAGGAGVSRTEGRGQGEQQEGQHPAQEGAGLGSGQEGYLEDWASHVCQTDKVYK